MEKFVFKFDGGIAAKHRIEAREFGNSLIGLDKAVNTGLILLAEGRAPKGRRRFDFVLTAQAPQAGSVEIIGAIAAVPWILPIWQDLVKDYGVNFVKKFITGLLFWHGGRKADAMEVADKMLEMLSEANRHTEVMAKENNKLILDVMDRMRPQARQIVEPVGRSATELLLPNSSGDTPIFVDAAMAEVIRSKEDLVLDDIANHLIGIDGIIAKTRYMKVVQQGENMMQITAEVRDPLFEQVPNPYRDAFAQGRLVTVRGRIARKGGEIAKLYITEFIS